MERFLTTEDPGQKQRGSDRSVQILAASGRFRGMVETLEGKRLVFS